MITNSAKLPTRPVQSAVTAVLLTAGVLGAGSASAFDFNLGGWDGNWDTTLSYGQLWRVEDRDLRLIGVANGGTGRSPNIDDGNLNFDTGIVSNAAKFVTELSLSRDNYGVFVRGSGLYDYEIENRDTERTPLSKDAKDLVGSYVRLLDAFAYARFDLSGHELDLRAGNMVVNWGESTFIQGGINSAINHFDVSALRVPGSELREAYMPQEMVKASFALTPNLTAEALYLWGWDETLPEPVGSYFSANDFAVEGGDIVFLGFGGYSDQGVDFRPLGGPYIENFQGISRRPTIEASDSGQYGVALKWFLPDFSQGTEFGFYFMNYHSKVPVISGVSGTQRGIGNGLGAAAAATYVGQALASGLPVATAIAIGTQAGVQAAALYGGDLAAATAQGYSTVYANLFVTGGNVSAVASRIAQHEYGLTAGYYTEYPEDLKLVGVSFNTQVGTTGIALQGEVSYKMDQPLQYDDIELFFAALSPFEQAVFAAQNPGATFPTECLAAAPTVTRCGQLGSYGLNQVVQGWGEFDVIQAQVTATKAFPPMLGASQLVAVIEAGVTRVQDFPNKLKGGPNGRGLRFNGPGTSLSGNAELAGSHDNAYDQPFNEVEPQNRFADANSWGYRLALRADYLNALGAWNVSPRLVFSHDVSGTTPGPGGNFVDGRHGLTLGVNMNLQATWEIDVNYTQFGGASRWNDINDRDFVAATLKYSF